MLLTKPYTGCTGGRIKAKPRYDKTVSQDEPGAELAQGRAFIEEAAIITRSSMQDGARLGAPCRPTHSSPAPPRPEALRTPAPRGHPQGPAMQRPGCSAPSWPGGLGVPSTPPEVRRTDEKLSRLAQPITQTACYGRRPSARQAGQACLGWPSRDTLPGVAGPHPGRTPPAPSTATWTQAKKLHRAPVRQHEPPTAGAIAAHASAATKMHGPAHAVLRRCRSR